MSNASKGTFKGVFTLNLARAVRNEGGIVCFLPKPFHYPNQDQRFEDEVNEAKENQDLITEAFNVHNATGKTPSELQQSNAELLEALKKTDMQMQIQESLRPDSPSIQSVGFQTQMEINKSLIQKHSQ